MSVDGSSCFSVIRARIPRHHLAVTLIHRRSPSRSFLSSEMRSSPTVQEASVKLLAIIVRHRGLCIQGVAKCSGYGRQREISITVIDFLGA